MAGRPHFEAACRSAGDCISDCGTAMNAPGLPNAIPRPGPGAGGVLVGSGKVGSPCLRMHCANLSIASLRLSDPCRDGPPPGINLKQVRCADWNAGEEGFTPEGI
jgi:hypothetical protein